MRSIEDRFNTAMALDALDAEKSRPWSIGKFGSVERSYFIRRVTASGSSETLTDNSGETIWYTLEEARDALRTLQAVR